MTRLAVHFVVGVVSLSYGAERLEDNVGEWDSDGDDGIAGFGALILVWAIGYIAWLTLTGLLTESTQNARNNPGFSIIDDRLFLEPYSSRKERGATLSLRF